MKLEITILILLTWSYANAFYQNEDPFWKNRYKYSGNPQYNFNYGNHWYQPEHFQVPRYHVYKDEYQKIYYPVGYDRVSKPYKPISSPVSYASYGLSQLEDNYFYRGDSRKPPAFIGSRYGLNRPSTSKSWIVRNDCDPLSNPSCKGNQKHTWSFGGRSQPPYAIPIIPIIIYTQPQGLHEAKPVQPPPTDSQNIFLLCQKYGNAGGGFGVAQPGSSGPHDGKGDGFKGGSKGFGTPMTGGGSGGGGFGPSKNIGVGGTGPEPATSSGVGQSGKKGVETPASNRPDERVGFAKSGKSGVDASGHGRVGPYDRPVDIGKSGTRGLKVSGNNYRTGFGSSGPNTAGNSLTPVRSHETSEINKPKFMFSTGNPYPNVVNGGYSHGTKLTNTGDNSLTPDHSHETSKPQYAFSTGIKATNTGDNSLTPDHSHETSGSSKPQYAFSTGIKTANTGDNSLTPVHSHETSGSSKPQYAFSTGIKITNTSDNSLTPDHSHETSGSSKPQYAFSTGIKTANTGDNSLTPNHSHETSGSSKPQYAFSTGIKTTNTGDNSLTPDHSHETNGSKKPKYGFSKGNPDQNVENGGFSHGTTATNTSDNSLTLETSQSSKPIYGFSTGNPDVTKIVVSSTTTEIVPSIAEFDTETTTITEKTETTTSEKVETITESLGKIDPRDVQGETGKEKEFFETAPPSAELEVSPLGEEPAA